MLKFALTANSVFSLSCGIIMLTLNPQLSGHIPLPPETWFSLGVCLCLFSVQLILMALKESLAKALTRIVVMSDVAWVIATSAALLIYFGGVSFLGVMIILTVNLVVAALAWSQNLGYQRMLQGRLPA